MCAEAVLSLSVSKVGLGIFLFKLCLPWTWICMHVFCIRLHFKCYLDFWSMFQDIATLGIDFHIDILRTKEIMCIWILKIMRVSKAFRPKKQNNDGSSWLVLIQFHCLTMMGLLSLMIHFAYGSLPVWRGKNALNNKGGFVLCVLEGMGKSSDEQLCWVSLFFFFSSDGVLSVWSFFSHKNPWSFRY